MRDSVQLGPELGMVMSGAFKEHLNYFVSALFMYPVYQSTSSKPEGMDLLNMEFEAGLSVKITKYVAIDYSFKAYRQPLIVDDWQIQNNILLTVAFEVPSPKPPASDCPPAPDCPTCPDVEAPADSGTQTATPAAGLDGKPTPPSETTSDESVFETDTPANATELPPATGREVTTIAPPETETAEQATKQSTGTE
jgi:hypothetical protein